MTVLPLRDAAECRYDVVTLGEVMLRLDPGDGRVRSTRTFSVSEGGAEYNVGRALRRCFGRRVAHIAAIGDNEVGRLLHDLMLQGGVSLDHVVWKEADDVGRFFIVTNDDGKKLLVKARMNGDSLVVNTPNGQLKAPSGIFPSHPWNKKILSKRVVLDTKTGKLLRLRPQFMGKEQIRAGGKTITASRYKVSGDETYDLWFDDSGNWVRLLYKKDDYNFIFALR